MGKTEKLNKFFVTVLLIGAGAFGLYILTRPSIDVGYHKVSITLADKQFSALVSDTDALREKGLSGRYGLEKGQAMLFVFDVPGNLGFWMKDMKFPIDIVWLDSSYHVVSIEKNVSPNTYPKVFFPTHPSLYVVELSAGTADSLILEIGDKVSIPSGK